MYIETHIESFNQNGSKNKRFESNNKCTHRKQFSNQKKKCIKEGKTQHRKFKMSSIN